MKLLTDKRTDRRGMILHNVLGGSKDNNIAMIICTFLCRQKIVTSGTVQSQQF